MVQLKRKVTLKRKQETILEPVKKKRSPYYLIGFFAIVCAVVIWLFVKKSPTEKEGQIAQVEIMDSTTNSEFRLLDEKVEQESTKVSIINKELVEKDTSLTNEPNNLEQQNVSEKQEKLSIPYEQGKSYEVYYFPFAEADYSKSNPELDKLVQILKENPSMNISISAFTDNIGTAKFNKILSTVRAKAIFKYIESQGIDGSRLSYKGYGISNSYDNSTESGRAKNRRVEFQLSV